MKTSDLLNSIFIIAVFIGLYIANILAIGKKNIEKNWPIYRCSPLVMPFANMFGHDTMKNFSWTAIKGTCGTYTHKKTGAAMVVYVDDMMLLSVHEDTDALLERS